MQRKEVIATVEYKEEEEDANVLIARWKINNERNGGDRISFLKNMLFYNTRWCII